jgi:transcriptional regulator with XRE-family HTH domain
MSNATTMTDLLRRTILDAIEAGRITYKGLERDSGVSRMSIMRFATGRRSLRLNVADKLAAYFGLALTSTRKAGE